ncbi:MAG: Ig-like domain-containing protein [Candidatus Pacearchaeota archaeon]
MTFSVNVPDTEAPLVTLISPANGSIDNDGNVTVSYSVTDNMDTELMCYVWSNTTGVWEVNANQQVLNGSTSSYTFTGLQNGVYAWNVECVDDGGNHGFASSNYTFLVLLPPAHIVINEFESNNGSSSGDWIELYNPAASDVDVTGWYIYDGGNANKFTLSGIIGANDYMIINAGNRLNNAGENLTLYDNFDQVVDDVSYNFADTLGNDLCWARVPNGQDTNTLSDWQFQQCTRGFSNDLQLGVILESDSYARTVSKNVNATYIINITNTGNVWNNFALGVINYNGANVWLSTNSITLQAGQSELVELNVSSATPGNYVVKVYANSTINIGLYNETQDITTTVINNPPTTPSNLIIEPTPAFKTSILEANAIGSFDPDDDNITYYYEFRNNATDEILQAWSTTNTFDCSASPGCNKNDNIKVIAGAFDGESWSENITGVKDIENTPPTQPTNLNLTKPIYVGDTLVADALGSMDIDGDIIVYEYLFENVNDSALLKDWSTDNSYIIQSSDAHDRIRVWARAFDGEAYSENISAEVLVSNSAPTQPTSLTPETGVFGGIFNITINCSGSIDVDNDPISYIIDAYYDNGTGFEWRNLDIGDGIFTWDVSLLPTQSGVDLRCKASDGQAESDYFNPLGTLSIDNSAPNTSANFTSIDWQVSDQVIELTAIDIGDAGVDAILYCIDQTDSCTPDQIYTGPITISSEGINYLRFRANDSVGNLEEIKSQVVKIDKTAPTITIFNPTDGTIYGTPNIELNYSVDENVSQVDSCWYVLDNGLPTPLPSCQNTTLTLSDGAHTLQVYANDSAGNEAYDEVSFIVDTKLPALMFVDPTPANNSWLARDWFIVNVSSDELLQQALIEIDGSNQTMSSNDNITWYINLTNLAEGSHTFVVYGRDLANNWNKTETRTVTIDLAAPEISLNGPANNSIINRATITFNWTTIDNLAPQLSCNLMIDGEVKNSTNVANGTSVAIDVTLADGSHSWNVSCTDLAGNSVVSETRSLTVDTQPPVWSNASAQPASPATYAPGRSYQFNITWIDATTAVDDVIFEFNGTNYSLSAGQIEQSGNEYFITLNDLPAGLYQYRWYANDSVGNRNATPVFEYVINKAQTVLNLIAEPNWTVTYGESANITCSANNAEVVIQLWRNNVLVASGNTVVNDEISPYEISAGNYNYVCNSTGTNNWTSASVNSTLVINKAQSNLTLLLNGNDSDITIIEGHSVNHTAILNMPQAGTLTLLRNGAQFASGLSPLTNISQYNVPGYYNITAVYGGDENYTGSTVTHFITVNLAIHDISVSNITYNKSNSTVYNRDVINIMANVSNLGNVNESVVNVILYDENGAVSSQLISLNVGETKEVSFSYVATAPENSSQIHTLEIYAVPVSGETNFSNNAQQINIEVWHACAVIDCSVFMPLTQDNSYNLDQPFLVKARLQNAWNSRSFLDFPVKLEVSAGLVILPTYPQQQYINLPAGQLRWAIWNVTSTQSGTQTLTTIAGNNDYSASKSILIT